MWKYNKDGLTFDDAKYITATPDNSFEPMVVSGIATLAQHYNSVVVTTATANDNFFGLSNATQNGCFTTVTPFYEEFTTASVINEAQPVTGGFMGSTTTCLDYVIDEMSLSGTHTLDLWTQDMGSDATGTKVGILPTAPTSRILAKLDNSDFLIWRARADPKDLNAHLTGALAVYN